MKIHFNPRLSRTNSDDPTGDKLLAKIKRIEPEPDTAPAPPAPPPVPLIAFRSRIVKIFHRTEKNYAAGFGEHAIFTIDDLGWYILLGGSYEALYCGPDEPKVEVGQIVEVKIACV